MQDIFGQKQEQQDTSSQGEDLLKDLLRRVRLLEERHSGIRKNIQVGERNMLDMNKRLTDEMKSINAEIGELKHQLQDLKDNLQMVVRELKETVKKEELHTMEKYIKLWEPLDYVTREEMENFVKSIKR